MNRITLTLEGSTRYLPGALKDPKTALIYAAVQVEDYDGDTGQTREFVVVWNERGNIRATRIADEGPMDAEWMIHGDAPVLDIGTSVHDMIEAISFLSDDNEIAAA